eukprot:6006181-Amphidinium_carterae.1
MWPLAITILLPKAKPSAVVLHQRTGPEGSCGTIAFIRALLPEQHCPVARMTPRKCAFWALRGRPSRLLRGPSHHHR